MRMRMRMIALHPSRLCEVPGIMPATCPALIHPFSLLLLLGLHRFAGSLSLGGSPHSSTSPADRSSVTTAGPRGAASVRGGSTFLAASLLLPRGKGSPEPSAAMASVSTWDPATDRNISSSHPAIMNKQKNAESPNTESSISSSFLHDVDAVSTSGNDKLRTLWTKLASASAAVTGSASSHTKITRSVNVAHLSPVIQTRRASIPSNMVDIAVFESVTSRVPFPKTPMPSLWEKKQSVSAAGSNHHSANSWDGDSTTSSFHAPGMDNSASLSQVSESTSHFFKGNFTVMDLSRKGLAAQSKLATSSIKMQVSSHATDPREKKRTSNATQPVSSARIMMTKSYSSTTSSLKMPSGGEKLLRTLRDFKSSQNPHSVSTDSSLEMSNSWEKTLQAITDISSFQNPHSISTTFSLKISSDGEKLLQTVKDINSSQNPHSAPTASNLEMPSGGEKALQTIRHFNSSQNLHSAPPTSNLETFSGGKITLQTRNVNSSQNPHSASTTSSLEMSSGGEKTLQTIRNINSSQNPHSASTTSSLEMSSGGEKTLQTIRNINSSQNPHSASTASSLKMSSGGEKTLRTIRNINSSQNPHSASTTSSLEVSSGGEKTLRTIRNINSSRNPHSASTASSLEVSSGGEKTLRTIRNINSSRNPHSASTASSLEVSSSGEKTLRTIRNINSSRNPHSASTTSSLEMSSGGEKTLRTIRNINSSQNPHSASTTSSLEVSSGGEKTLRTIRNINSSQNPHSASTASSLEMSSGGEKTLQTIRNIKSSRIPHSASTTSSLEVSSGGGKTLRTIRNINSSQNPHSASTTSSLVVSSGGEKTLRTIRNINSSRNPHSASTASSLEMSSGGEKTLRSIRNINSSQNPHSASTASSLEMSSGGEKTLQTIRNINSSQNPHSASTASNLEMSSGGEKTLRTIRNIKSSRNPHSASTASSLEMSSGGEKTLRSIRNINSSQNPHSASTASSLEMSSGGEKTLRTIRNIKSSRNPYSASTTSSLEVSSGGEKTLRTIRNINSSRNPHSASTTSSLEVSSGGEKTLRTIRNINSSRNPHSASTTSSLEVSSGGEKALLSMRDFNSSQDPHSVSTTSSLEVSSGGEKALLSMRDFNSSQDPHPIFTVSDLEMSSSSDLSDSSYEVDPGDSRQMDLSTQDPDETEATHINSQGFLEVKVQARETDLSTEVTDFMEATSTYSWAPSQTTAIEDSSQLRSSSDKERISSSQTDGVSVSSLSKRSEESTLRTVRDVSSSQNETKISTAANTILSKNSDLANTSHGISPEPITRMNLSPRNTDFTEGTQAPLGTTAEEENGQPQSRSRPESSISIYHLGITSISEKMDVEEGRMLQDISLSQNITQGSIVQSNETSRSSGLTDSAYLLTLVQTEQIDVSSQVTDFTEGTSMRSQASSESTESSSNRESRIPHSDLARASVSSSSERDENSMPQTLRDVKTQTSTTSNVNITTSSLHIAAASYGVTSKQISQRNLSSGDTDLTKEVLTYSEAPSETTDTIGRHHALSHFKTEERATHTESMFSTTVVKDETLASLTNQSRSTEATELSAFDLENVDSSVITQPSTAVSQYVGEKNSPSAGIDFTENLEQSLLTSSSKASVYSSSTQNLSSSASHFQTIKGSGTGRRLSVASTDSVYLSTTFLHGAERTLRSLPDNITSDDAADSRTYNTQTSKASDLNVNLTSVAETEKHNSSLNEVQFTGPSTEYSLEFSSVAPLHLSPNDSSTIGSNHHSTSGSRVLDSYTDSTYNSTPFSTGEEQTTQSIINTTVNEETESTSLHMKNYDSSRPEPSTPKTYSGMTDFSVKLLDIPSPSTEVFQILSSPKVSTQTAFQSELSDTGTDYQLMSSTEIGKQASVSHTDSTYILTTFARGGERTLLSVPNNSTSADSSESSTYSAEISTPSESVRPVFSTSMDFSENSTEPLAVHSMKTPEYSSAVSEPDPTQFYSASDSASAGSLPFSSSSTMLSEQDSLSPTQPSTLFFSAQTSLQSSSSAFLSSLSFPPTPFVAFSPMLSSTEPSTFSLFSSGLPLPSSPSSSLQPSESFETSVSMAVPEGATGAEPHQTGGSNSEYNTPITVYPLENSTILMATETPLLAETTEQLANHSSPRTTVQEETKGSKRQAVTAPGTSTENVPILTTSPPYLQELITDPETAKATTATKLNTVTPKDTVSSSAGTKDKNLPKITHTTVRLPTAASATDYVVTTKLDKVQSPPPSKVSYSTGIPTKVMEKSSATTEHRIATTSFFKTLTSGKTTVPSFPTSLVPTRPTTAVGLGSPKVSPTPHEKDIDECLSKPCPTLATCTNTDGSFQCICSLGYQMEKGKCSLVRTFVGQFPLMFNTTGGTYSELHQVEGVIINLLNESLSTLPGYYTSTVKASRQSGTIQVSIWSTFSLVSNITLSEIMSTVRRHIQACKTPIQSCQFISNLTQLYRVGGLCKHKDPECDKGTSVCIDLDGIAVCQCKPGYFRYNKLDHSCRACEDGYKLENDTCVSCPFGLGGFNCGNPYQLITIVIAAAGGGLLLIMGIALIVTCCQKNKNDISKLIFKSGDFQMSPYAEYPKNPRVQDWSRETIEMQENGSTKNLLQMTDVYYMPTNLRNPELERNGVYPPYTGLPGSRHSCIYPGQYNPSFISDDSRRDYF